MRDRQSDDFLEAQGIEGLFSRVAVIHLDGTEVVVERVSERTKEAVMNVLVTLTATTVLLSSLLLLRRIW